MTASKPKVKNLRNAVEYRGRIHFDRVVKGRRYWIHLKIALAAPA